MADCRGGARAFLWVAMLVVCGSACDGERGRGAAAASAEGGRGEWMPTGKADELATCEGACGGQAEAGCWCDAECEDYGDCCPDIDQACHAAESCDDEDGNGGGTSEPMGDCQAQLSALGAEFTATEHDPESPSGFPGLSCEIEDPVLLHGPIHGVGLRYFENENDTPVLMSCEAALSVVKSAAIAESLGAEEIIHMGTYNCRVIAGTSKLSEHASGNAIDVFGFTLNDGTEISVLDDWQDDARLREFTDRMWADDLWNVILTPEFNAAHENHVHLDRTPGGNTYE